MHTTWALLRPTKLKLVFLLEWILFCLVALCRGDLETGRQALVAVYPLLILYLVACILEHLSRRTRQLGNGWCLLGVALILTAVDQMSKVGAAVCIPHQTSVPLVAGWLHLGHVRNPQGSWVLKTLGTPRAAVWLLLIVVGIVLLVSISCYRYYTSRHRRSVWADVAFLGLFAGCTSWACDIVCRGHVIDFLILPGVVAADLKDLWITFGAASLLAEMLDNPGISRRPKGLRQDFEDLLQMAARIASFSVQELRGLRHALNRQFGRSSHDSRADALPEPKEDPGSESGG